MWSEASAWREDESEDLSDMPDQDAGDADKAEATSITAKVIHSPTAVAAALHMTPRTLQRRLAEDGTTFRALVDATRKSILVGSIERNESNDETMRHAGYTNSRAFRRALKRWNLPDPDDTLS